jgi:hypothetical protein
MSVSMKPVVYRGGLVSFLIPSNWREEYEPEGGGTFYDDRPDSGTLRLNVITAESKDGEPAEQAIERSFPADSCELLPSGVRLRRRKLPGEERGTALVIYRWELGVTVPPSRIRVVCFTHTVLATRDSDPATKAELSFIEDSIRRAEFSREYGV